VNKTSWGKKLYAGVDIGGTKTAVVLSAKTPILLGRREFATNVAQGPEPVLQQIISGIQGLLSTCRKSVDDLIAIGVSCGSPLDQERGIIQQPPNLPTWVNVPIKEIIEHEFSVPCFVENDANGGALAEFHYGAAKGSRNAVFLTMGTGIGAGLILEGRLYRGTSNSAGEIGHVRLTEDGPFGYGRKGTVEGWASGGGMARFAAEKIKLATVNGERTSLSEIAAQRAVTARDIWEAAQNGDALAAQIVASTGKRLGQALAILIDLLNPDCIAVGGLALRMGEALLAPAREVIHGEALPGAAEVCRIVPAELGERIGDVAAICIAQGKGDEHGSAPKTSLTVEAL
jgi:glucokinase